MSVKTESSRRRIPIHQTLLDLAFLEYVETLRGAKDERLFPGLKPNKYGRWTPAWSKWWGRYARRKANIVDPRKVSTPSGTPSKTRVEPATSLRSPRCIDWPRWGRRWPILWRSALPTGAVGGGDEEATVSGRGLPPFAVSNPQAPSRVARDGQPSLSRGRSPKVANACRYGAEVEKALFSGRQRAAFAISEADAMLGTFNALRHHIQWGCGVAF